MRCCSDFRGQLFLFCFVFVRSSLLVSGEIQGRLLGSTQPKRASVRARQGGPPLGPTQGLLSSSTQRAFSRARHRERKGLLSCSEKRIFSRTRQRSPPPRLNTESSSQARHRASSQTRDRGHPVRHSRKRPLSGSAKRVSY